MRKKFLLTTDIAALLILAILCIICFNSINLLGKLGGDTGDIAYGIYAGMAQVIHDGEYPLWNPYLWGGMTNAGNPGAQVFYPLTYILCILCYNTETATLSYSMLYYQTIIHIFVLATGLYILLRVLGRRKSVCLFISILATFSGCAFQLRNWICLYSGFVYVPLLLAAYIYMARHVERKESIFLCIPGGVLGITGLASVTHGALLNIFVLVIAYFCYAWSYRREYKKLWKLTWKSLFVGFLGIGVMAISLFPIAEFLLNSYRDTGDGEVIQGLQQMSYESFSHYTLTTENFQAISGYNGWIAIGIILLLFFVCGFFCKKKSSEFWCGLSLSIISFLYCFGIEINKIIYYIPFLNNIREPYLYSFLFVIGVAIVAGYGLDEILCNALLFSKTHEGGWIVYAIIFCVIMLLPINFTWGNLLMVLGLIFIVTASIRCGSMKVYFCTLVVLTLICTHEYYVFIHAISERTDNREEIIAHIDKINTNVYSILQDDLPTQEDSYRVLQWTTQGNAYPPNMWTVWGINETTGYMNPIYSKAMNIHTNWHIEKRAALQNIKYIMCTSKESQEFTDWLENCGFVLKDKKENIFPHYENADPNEVLVFENNNRMGNAWFIEKVVPYSNNTDITELNNMINDPEFDTSKMALLNVDTYGGNIKESYAQEEGAYIEQHKYGANSIELIVNATDEALIVTSEIMTSGWNVYVDNQKSDIIEVNTFFRGVIVEKGQHIILFRYKPLSVSLGATISIISSIIVFIGICQIVISKKKMNKLRRE